jgi:hypothetical protein
MRCTWQPGHAIIYRLDRALCFKRRGQVNGRHRFRDPGEGPCLQIVSLGGALGVGGEPGGVAGSAAATASAVKARGPCPLVVVRERTGDEFGVGGKLSGAVGVSGRHRGTDDPATGAARHGREGRHHPVRGRGHPLRYLSQPEAVVTLIAQTAAGTAER